MTALLAEAIAVARGGQPVLANVSAAVSPGRVLVILGPNGAGKSTLLHVLAGLLAPAQGRVLLEEKPLATLPTLRRARAIGFLAQQAEIHWDIDVETLVGLGRLPWGREDVAAVAEALAETGTEALAQRRVSTLSGGERARALLARVLAGTPRYLLADEPLAALDPAHQQAMLRLVRAVAARGVGVALVLHDLTLAARIADDVLLLRQGRVIAAGPRESILTPAALAELYGIGFHIGQDSAGDMLIAPAGR